MAKCDLKDCTIGELQAALKAKKEEEFNYISLEFTRGMNTLTISFPLLEIPNYMTKGEFRQFLESKNVTAVRFEHKEAAVW